MLHGINNTFLYSAKKIVAVWVHETDAVELRGTGFFIDKDSELILVTNRHVVEPGYSDAKYKEYQVKSIRFESLKIPIHLLPNSPLLIFKIGMNLYFILIHIMILLA